MTNRTIRGLSLSPAQIAALFPEYNKTVESPIETVAVDTTLGINHFTVLVDATTGNRVITLPTAASAFSEGIGRVYNVKKIDGSANTVTVDGAAAETIDGAATQVLTAQYQSMTIQSNGTAWSIT